MSDDDDVDDNDNEGAVAELSAVVQAYALWEFVERAEATGRETY